MRVEMDRYMCMCGVCVCMHVCGVYGEGCKCVCVCVCVYIFQLNDIYVCLFCKLHLNKNKIPSSN